MRRKMKTSVALVTAAVLAVIVAGVAAATIPDGTGTINACYKNLSGALRVIDPSAGGACSSSETSLSWSQAGPQGFQGAQGIQGPQGPQGPQGLAGLTEDPGSMTVVDYAYADPQIGGFFKQLTCPQGTNVLWGGWEWQLFSGNAPPADMESFPTSDTSWGFAIGASSQSKGDVALVSIGCAVAR